VKKFFLIFPLLIFGGLGSWLYLDKKVENFSLATTETEKEITFPQGAGVKEIGEILEEEKIIGQDWWVIYYVWRKGLKADLKAGTYKLKAGMTVKAIVEKITAGKVEEKKAAIEKITIPEGFRNTKITALLKKEQPQLAEEFSRLADCRCLNQPQCDCDVFSADFSILQEIPRGVDLEGYLFPDTYFLSKNETGRSLIKKMLDNFQARTANLVEAQKNSKMSWHQVLTLASIIEREAVKKEDKKMVAGIFHNRLQAKMPLQSCATIAYAKNEDKIQFSFEDTQWESPYNTYLNVGLPPGPIANPGLEAIEAALFPTKTDYYFFLSNPDTGQMVYAKTLEEQNENKRKNGL